MSLLFRACAALLAAFRQPRHRSAGAARVRHLRRLLRRRAFPLRC